MDAATLTGSIVVALGHVNNGVFSNDAALLDRWMHAAQAQGDTMWQMPMDDEYREQLKSVNADLQNIGGRPGGSITAAWFLREFAGETPWIHLDICGTAWLDDAKPWMPKGPTGIPCAVSYTWPSVGKIEGRGKSAQNGSAFLITSGVRRFVSICVPMSRDAADTSGSPPFGQSLAELTIGGEPAVAGHKKRWPAPREGACASKA